MHLPKGQNLPMIFFQTPYPSSERAVSGSFFLFLVVANSVHHCFHLESQIPLCSQSLELL